MRFLVDECTGPNVSDWLSKEGYEVFCVFQETRGSSDDDILQKACNKNWVLITNDKDFGELVYRENRLHHGIIFMRLSDERSASKIAALEKLLAAFSDRLADAFIVLTETQIRFAGQKN